MKKVRIKKKAKRFLTVICACVALLCLILVGSSFKNSIKSDSYFIASIDSTVVLYDDSYELVNSVIRGTEVKLVESNIENDSQYYDRIKYAGVNYLIKKGYLVNKKEDVVLEKERYVRTSLTVYQEENSSKILSRLKKGSKVEILGYDYLKDDGSVNKYEISIDGVSGYIYAKYTVNDEDSALANYNENGEYDYNSQFTDTLGGGSAANLDYYPYDKPSFKDNVMPDETRTIYINGAAVKNIDDYIEFALNNNINAMVVDIKDNTVPAYESKVMAEYSPTNYKYALNTFDDYKSYIKKIKDSGLYVIGRITTFKDSYYIADHPETAINNSYSGKPFEHNGSYWPSAYRREVWEFNVELAKEAVLEMGFNEIQFDYVRFPDRTYSLEVSKTIDMNNPYDEEKAEAIQEFVMYACDEIHQLGAYVSVDVFGESSHDYVTAYGQYWAAISNVADVISAMPYPDHFSPHNYGIQEVVWTVPYKLLSTWGDYVVEKQKHIPTPAKVRTWIQAYDTVKEPSVEYNAQMVSEEIRALYNKGLNAGYMTWNSGSNLSKYKSISPAFKKEY